MGFKLSILNTIGDNTLFDKLIIQQKIWQWPLSSVFLRKSCNNILNVDILLALLHAGYADPANGSLSLD